MTRTNFTALASTVALAFALTRCDRGEPAAAASHEVATRTPARAVVRPDPPPEVQRPADTAPADPAMVRVQLAAAVAKEISAAPERADEILGKHGLSREKFDALVFEIAADPALTRAYMQARRG